MQQPGAPYPKVPESKVSPCVVVEKTTGPQRFVEKNKEDETKAKAAAPVETSQPVIPEQPNPQAAAGNPRSPPPVPNCASSSGGINSIEFQGQPQEPDYPLVSEKQHLNLQT